MVVIVHFSISGVWLDVDSENKLNKATLKIMREIFAQRLWKEFGIAELTIQNLCKRCIGWLALLGFI